MSLHVEQRREEQASRPHAISQRHERDDLRELVRKLWRRKMVVFGTVVTLTTLAFVTVNQITPRYTGQTFVMIDVRKTQVVDVEAVMSGLPSDIATIVSEVQVLQSRGLAQKVIERLRLDRNPEFNEELRPKSGFEELKITMAELLNPWNYLPEEWLAVMEQWSVIVFGPREEKELSEEEKAERQHIDVIDVVLDGLRVKPQGRSRVIGIAFESENPRTAASAANAFADLYIVDQLEAKFEATQRATAWLSDRLTDLREKVEASERAVEAYRANSGLIASKGATVASQQMSEINTQLILARSARAESEARLHQVETLISSSRGLETTTEVLSSLLIQSLRAQEAEVTREAAELSEEYGERHPRMINARAEIRDLRNSIHAEVDKIVKGLRNEVGVARAREASLRVSLDELEKKMGGLNKAEVRLRVLAREANANRLLFEIFLSRFKETSAQEDIQQADARIISRADVPQLPSYPKKWLILALVLVGSGALGVFLAFFIELLDRGFRSTEQIQQLTGIPALGLIPSLKGLRSIGTTPEDYVVKRPASAYSESIRTLHTGLLMSNIDAPPKVILVSSSLPLEGKTTICLSLARIMAMAGQKVVLVEAELRRPRAHQAFGGPGKPGMVELLAGKASLEEVISEDKATTAHLIPAGEATPNAPELLGSKQMRNLLERLSNAYDLVIVDSPPVLVVSDARVLATLVDKCVFVTRWASTPREVATNGLQQLLDAGADVAGVLLTMVNVRKHARYGYGDSGYYYGRTRQYYSD